jgi:hypothetical protein
VRFFLRIFLLNLVCSSHLHILSIRPTRPILLDFNVWRYKWKYKLWSFSFVIFSLLRPNISISILLSNTFAVCSFLNVRDQYSTTGENTTEIRKLLAAARRAVLISFHFVVRLGAVNTTTFRKLVVSVSWTSSGPGLALPVAQHIRPFFFHLKTEVEPISESHPRWSGG